MFSLRRLGAIVGLAAPVYAFTFILLAIASWPEFSWTNNALSDMGVAGGVTSLLFTLGVCGTGVLAFLFAVLGLYSFTGFSRLGKVGAAFFAAASVALFFIGVFNEHFFPPTHYVVSVAFFVFAPLAFFILTSAFYLKHKRSLAAFTVMVGLVAAIPWILQYTIRFVPHVAIPETISGLSISCWVLVLSYLMLKSKA